MIYSSRALTDPASSKTRTTRHTSNCTCDLPKKDHTRNVDSSTIATSKAAASTPDKLCPHTASAMTRQLWLRQALSAPNAETPSQKNQKNQQLRILDPSPNQNIQDHKPNPYRCTSARFCSAVNRSPLSSLRSTAGASWNMRDTGSEVLSASSSPSQATLTTTRRRLHPAR